MSESLTVGGYSFYLNVVVISSGPRDDNGTVSDEPEAPKEPPKEETVDFSTTKDPVVDFTAPHDLVDDDKEQAIAVVSTPEKSRNKLLADSRSLVDSFSLSLTKQVAAFVAEEKQRNTPDPKKLVQGGQRFMNSIGQSISKKSSNISKKASAFVASKTMVSRAEKAVVECIPMVTEEIGVEMSISKRFQQGPVFVLEVDMKGCDLLELLETVLGDESAQHYRNVREGLKFLDMPGTMAAFEAEILPKVRTGMMTKMSDIVPEKMKLKKGNGDLEIQCVALEDAEEAKWLYNFLEFMEQMK
jgi:hypothetical protein